MTVRTNRYMSPNTGVVPKGIDENTWIYAIHANGKVTKSYNWVWEGYWRIKENCPHTILYYVVMWEDNEGEYCSAMEKFRNGTPFEELDWEIIEYGQ